VHFIESGTNLHHSVVSLPGGGNSLDVSPGACDTTRHDITNIHGPLRALLQPQLQEWGSSKLKEEPQSYADRNETTFSLPGLRTLTGTRRRASSERPLLGCTHLIFNS
jgi:hypothetical protein